jgi:hypothetical protein
MRQPDTGLLRSQATAARLPGRCPPPQLQRFTMDEPKGQARSASGPIVGLSIDATRASGRYRMYSPEVGPVNLKFWKITDTGPPPETDIRGGAEQLIDA